MNAEKMYTVSLTEKEISLLIEACGDYISMPKLAGATSMMILSAIVGSSEAEVDKRRGESQRESDERKGKISPVLESLKTACELFASDAAAAGGNPNDFPPGSMFHASDGDPNDSQCGAIPPGETTKRTDAGVKPLDGPMAAAAKLEKKPKPRPAPEDRYPQEHKPEDEK